MLVKVCYLPSSGSDGSGKNEIVRVTMQSQVFPWGEISVLSRVVKYFTTPKGQAWAIESEASKLGRVLFLEIEYD